MPDDLLTMAAPSEWTIRGMTCNNCARHAREAIEGVPGVASAVVRLEAGSATVRWRPEATPNDGLIEKAVSDAGYEAKKISRPPAANGHAAPSAAPRAAMSSWGLNVALGMTATAVLMAGEWIFHWDMQPWFQWLAFALAGVVQVVCGARFYRGAWAQLKVGQSNMDTLVSLGSTVAFAYSVYVLLSGQHTHLYFMEAAAIISLISAGHFLEARVGAKAASALEGLMQLAPATARRLEGMKEVVVPVAELKLGDSVVVKPGDRIPVDGTVAFGTSAVDESMLTGESMPVAKGREDRLYAGTVNQNGRLVMRVTATGEATALAHVIAVVERAQNSRASIQRLGDRVSNVFVPIIVVVAILTALWWGLAPDSARSVHAALSQWLWTVPLPGTVLAVAIIQAVGVLIVACPCAMGLATPAAIMAGTNVAATRGILIRDGQALEKSGRITAVLFDKTGTLTAGQMSVVASADLRGMEVVTPRLETLAAALAKGSTHPLSIALARLDPNGTGASKEFQEIQGQGVQAVWSESGELAGHLLRLGSLAWLKASGVDCARAQTFLQQRDGQGVSILGLAANQELLGVFALRDSLKPGVADVMKSLIRNGKKVWLVTGDNPQAAAAIARLAGIPEANVFAHIRPEQKAEVVERLQQQGEKVAFVGDGINDAPALEQADLGIAVSRASDVAREAADIILLNSDVEAIPAALSLAQATLQTIKQNLFWAFFYNAAAVPLAALGFLSPILCAAAMGLSDVMVIGNALRLYRFRKR